MVGLVLGVVALVLAGHLLGGFALDETELVLLSAGEEGVLEDEHVVVLFDFVEVVHVELPHEGAEVGVPEVLGEDFLGEGEGVDDDEPDVILVPAYDAFVVGVLPNM